MELLKHFLSAVPISFLAMITVINPLGTGFVLGAMTEGIDPESKKRLAKKILINCLGLFLVVLIFGSYILAFFGLSLPIIRVAGGLLLASMGWNMLNAKEANKETEESLIDHPKNFFSQSFYPFTFPVTAGPGCIAVLFTLTIHHFKPNQTWDVLVNLLGTFIGLVGVAIVVYYSYLYSSNIAKRLGESGAHALNRIMAFITFCIGLEIVWAGVKELLKL